MTKQYRIAQFAQLAGVTVRTLQYYDRIGLLHPSATTEANYRLYTTADLRQLQQIVLLKWMGFSLSEIKSMLSLPNYPLGRSLLLQKTAVDRQIGRLQEASAALERAMAAVATHGDEALDLAMIQTILRGVVEQPHTEWVRDYFDETTWTSIQTRGLQYSQAELAEFEQAWRDVYAAFAAQRHEPPDSPAVQAVAAQMDGLIGRFTAGDTQAEAGLKRLQQAADAGQLSPEQMPFTPFGGVDAELRRFMQQAHQIYRQGLL